MKSKEARRLIKFGNSSHVLSIPKDWIEKNKLEKGDLIFLDENEFGNIVLHAKEKEKTIEEKGIKIDIDGKEPNTIRREITAAYLNNLSTVRLEGHEIHKKLKLIRNFTKSLIGLDIIKQTREEIILKSFLDPETIKFEEITTRIDIMIRALFQDVGNILKSDKKISNEDLSEIIERDEDINGLFFLSHKILKEKFEHPFSISHTNLMTTFDSWHTNFNLEDTGDNIKNALKIIKENKLIENKLVRKQILSIWEELEANYLEVMKARFSRDILKALQLASRKKEVNKKCDTILEKSWKERGFPELCEKLRGIARTTHSIGRRVYS